MTWYALDDVEDAWTVTKEFLLPFDLRRWLKLAVIVFFVGGGVGSGGTGWSTNVPMRGGEVPGGFPGDLPLDQPRVLALVVGIGALVLLLVIAFGVVGSVMQFVLVEAVRREEVRLREPFRRSLGKGLRLFGFQVLLVLGLLLLPLALLGAGLALGVGPAFLLPFVPLLLLAMLVGGVAVGLTTDFVVPTMIRMDAGVLAGWRRFWSTLLRDWRQYAVYLVARWVLGAVAGALVAIVTLVLLLPVILLAGALFFFVVAAPAPASPLWIVPLALVLLPLGLLALVVALLVQVPVVTYFRYYSLLVLGDSDPELNLVEAQRARARAEGGS